MRVLVACEFSGTVGAAFMARGHRVLTCDILRTERPDVPHYRGDVRHVLANPAKHLGGPIDLMIAHPPCTHLAVSGALHFAAKAREDAEQGELELPGVEPRGDRQAKALEFVQLLLDAEVPRICVENPVSIISSRIREADQTIQPWQHGHGETKATCLWLKGLPKLEPSHVVNGREGVVHAMGPSDNRWRERSRTYPGIAAAMALQWG